MLSLTLAGAVQAQGAAPVSGRYAPAGRATLDSAMLAAAYTRAAQLPRLRSLLVSHDGRLVGERYFRGARRGSRANIKSASKSIISALVGIAIREGRIRSVHQPIGDFLSAQMSPPADPRVREISIEDLLTMRSGLETTSFENYGRWVTSRHWVRHVLTRRMAAEPGGAMIYSTGSTHLLSAILTRATGMSTWQYANRKLAQPLGFSIPRWQADPQGVYFGGNDMYLTPREMVTFGELYLRGGRTRGSGRAAGRQLLPRAWVDSTMVRRTRSGWSGQEYGYGWWLRTSAGHEVAFAWGYGGQFIFVVPDLRLVVVTTSDPDARTRESGHLDAVHALLDQYIVPAARAVVE